MTSLLATTLCFLLASAPVSTAACDLSCWLHATLSDCHGANLAYPGQNHSMSMPSDMNMSAMAMNSANEENAQANDQKLTAAYDHTMPNMEMAADGVVPTAGRKFGTNNPVKDGSPCVHERCSKTSLLASAASPGANHSPPDCPQPRSRLRNLRRPVYVMEAGTSPPEIPAIVGLATALRI